ncbi:MAG: extracellular matrix regulator RemB [Bacillota bacterium]
MFLHLGADVMVLKSDVIAILDLQTKVANSTRDFLKMARDEGLLEAIIEEGEKHRSFVITSDKVYLSPISCGTLKKRSGLDWQP